MNIRNFSVLALAAAFPSKFLADAADPATPADPAAPADAAGPEGYLWLACGSPGKCGSIAEFPAKADEKHEVRCCSSSEISGWKKNSGCDVWGESDLLNADGGVQCFHEATYAEAQKICSDNNAYVCSKEEVDAGCTKASGCGHDADLIWTSSPAPEPEPLPPIVPVDPESYMWLACGSPGKCGSITELPVKANEKHEVRCCSSRPISGWVKNSGCDVWGESDLLNAEGAVECFHEATYAEAQQICFDNNAYVCSMEEVGAGCAKSSGCGHDTDLIWTSSAASEPEPIEFPNTDPVDPEDWLYLSCGKGQHLCGIGIDLPVQAKETHELRCCSPLPKSGWKKDPNCDFWHESDLLGLDDRLQCFHDVTYAEAQEICAHNGAHVCTKEQVDSGCAKGSGCGHDGDLIWTGASAPARDLENLKFQDPVGDEEWLYLECGSPGKCGYSGEVTSQAKEKHEVRCCSDLPVAGWKRSANCQNWHESNLLALDGTPDTCFHESTYSEAQEICKANGGYVCTRDQVKSGCVKGSGCGHDADFIWTSTGNAPPTPPPLPVPTRVADDAHLFIACGAGIQGCGGEAVGVAEAKERHEVRCCTGFPLPGFKKNPGATCSNYHDSKLTALDGTPDQCFHASTYTEAQDICHANNAYVCSMTEILDGCAKGSGCGHDGDLIWTSTTGTEEAIAAYKTRRTQAEAITGVCVGPSGRISGDPHFTTFDNLKYDCQGHGEFVIAMSKGSDPLAIHGRFVRVRETGGPTITRSLAIKVVDEVPTIQVTAPLAKIDGNCPLTFSMGKEETLIPTEEIIAFVSENYDGAVEAFSNGKNIIFSYPEVGARVQITVGGGGNRCVLNTNLCLTPESHGGADNIVGLLGSPDGVKENDWMDRDGNVVPLPEICEIPDMTNTEAKQCKGATNRGGHEWCMENWCIGHADNSLWGEASHAIYNECDNIESDDFFDNVDTDPAIVEACEDAVDPDGCVMDATIAAEDGEDVTEFVDTVLEEDEDASVIDTLNNETDPTAVLEGWDAPPVLSHTNAIEIELPPTITVNDEEGPNPACPVCKATGWGDPHIITFDGVTYDVHVIGELTFLKSLSTDFEIQARLEIVENHPKGPAVTTAIVVHEDSTKNLPDVQVSLARPVDGPSVTIGNCPLQLFVAGEYRDIKTGSGVDTVTVQTHRKRIVVEYPSTNLRVDIQVRTWRNTCHLSVKYILSDCRCDETLVGILGQPDGDAMNDWHEHDGTAVEIPTSKKERRTKKAYDYSTTWCLENAAASHFTYEGDNDFSSFDKCNPEQYDDTLDEIIDGASPELIANCTTDGEVDYGCVIECDYFGEEGCQEYKDEVAHTETAEITPPAEPEDPPADEDTPETDGNEDTPETDGDEDTPETDGDEDTPETDGNEDTPPETDGNEDTPPETDGNEDTPETDGNEDTPDEPDVTTSGNDASTPTEVQDIPQSEEPPVSESSGSLGDPHFKTWLGEHFEYHGQCDMILAKDKDFADGIGMEVQIRTKLVRFWSYIKQAAIRIGDDILEVEGNSDPEDKDTHFWVNFEYAAEAKTIGGFPLKISYNGANKRSFEIDLSSKFPGQKIAISTFREFIRVDFQHTTAEAFGNAVGMMGDFKTGNLLARDGSREIDDFYEFGNEWQLLPSDDMLFHDKAEPQFPKRCVVPEDPQGQRRRRLGESTITVEEAEAACSKVVGDSLDIKDCVYDILATQDLDMVGAF